MLGHPEWRDVWGEESCQRVSDFIPIKRLFHTFSPIVTAFFNPDLSLFLKNHQDFLSF